MKAVGNHMETIHFLGIRILFTCIEMLHRFSGKEKKAVNEGNKHIKG